MAPPPHSAPPAAGPTPPFWSRALGSFSHTPRTIGLVWRSSRSGLVVITVLVVLSAVQLVPRMQDRADRIREAQAARGLAVDGSFLARGRALVPLIGPVVLGALVDVRERTLALEARGFGARPERTAYRVVPDSGPDRILRVALLIATALVVGAWIGGLVR